MADRPRAPRRRDRGTTLLLFPAAVLVLMVLAAIAVDLSLVHVARRELVRVCSHAADDAASVIDQDALRRGEPLTVDLEAARRVVRAELAAADLPGRLVGPVRVERGPAPTSVVVEATLEVDRIFAPGFGDRSTDRVTARVEGHLLDAPG